jgi:hypothetical protein
MSESEFLQLAAEIEDIQTNYPQSVAIGKRFALLAQQIDKEWHIHCGKKGQTNG